MSGLVCAMVMSVDCSVCSCGVSGIQSVRGMSEWTTVCAGVK